MHIQIEPNERTARTLLRTTALMMDVAALPALGFLTKFVPLAKRIFASEIVVRALFYPQYIDKQQKLKPSAFEPFPGTDEISVMRCYFLGQDRCKSKAKSMERTEPKKEFYGFALLSVRAVRELSMEVVDSRIHFLGHADVKTGVAMPPKGVPRSPEDMARYRERAKMLTKLAIYRKDPDPRSSKWSGEALRIA